MSHPRRVALVAGALYLLTIVTSIPALALKAPVLADPASLALPGQVDALRWAAALEVVLAVACVGTAVALYPIVRRHSETLALGFVAARLVEGAVIMIGVVAMLSLLDVPRDPDGSATEAALVAVHDWAFLLGPGLIPVANALLLGTALYRSGLVPRALPLLGIFGAPLLLASTTGSLFGMVDQVSGIAAVAALPIALWEIGLGVWLVVRGFRREAVARLSAAPALQPAS
ncbi:DUF4386 domain-containing protein [Microbacterium album]|uniref:DUF4386 domain-containing protein n=1 Tax=Microbacterium album TaxID=2053191 RepID=A0A917II39_9MICO|nr:DUF4386 domain-containing protein [Microbacterium album]GGH50940.1 hypothetical protein GCM10010921_30050 [Microbacterium album]